MMTDWREHIMDQVTEKQVGGPGVKTIAVFFPPRWYSLVRDAARMRGLPLGGYVRRATMAFIAHDLGLDFDDVMRDEPLLRLVGHEPERNRRRHAKERGHGAWEILGLK
jgi:hypothetical protein